MPAILPATSTNHLLAALPAGYRKQFLASCESVELIFADVLSEPGERIRHVYFPIAGFISLILPVNGRAGLEVGLIGNEGMLGASLILGEAISPLHVLVQGAGSALRMRTASFLKALEQSPALQRELKHYLRVAIAQLAQTTVCTHFHRVEARLARWLLMTRDRAHSDKFNITQEFLAYMLGVRRVGVTKAAIALKSRELIRYSRGEIAILDRKGLENAACECYAIDKATYARVMGY